ncbi:MAG: type II toxin-antitoxin system HicB family antitoxin [Desulfobulbus sp.]|nr:type II toxin-antitoxin system HicB family antitoxin [Desulfobulbus sp.]
MKYPVAIHKDQDSCFGVSVPDIPGCFSAGETIDEALNNIQEAISDHLQILAEEGKGAPEPSEMEKHYDNPDYAQALWAHVTLKCNGLHT